MGKEGYSHPASPHGLGRHQHHQAFNAKGPELIQADEQDHSGSTSPLGKRSLAPGSLLCGLFGGPSSTAQQQVCTLTPNPHTYPPHLTPPSVVDCPAGRCQAAWHGGGCVAINGRPEPACELRQPVSSTGHAWRTYDRQGCFPLVGNRSGHASMLRAQYLNVY